MGTEEGLTALLGPSLTLPCGSPQASPQRSALEPLSSSAVGGVWAGLPFPAGSCWQPQPSAWRPRPLPAAIPALNLWGSVSLCACCVAVMQRSTKAVREPQRQWAQRDSVPTFPAASRHQMPSRTHSVSCAGVQVGEEGPYLTGSCLAPGLGFHREPLAPQRPCTVFVRCVRGFSSPWTPRSLRTAGIWRFEPCLASQPTLLLGLLPNQPDLWGDPAGVELNCPQSSV